MGKFSGMVSFVKDKTGKATQAVSAFAEREDTKAAVKWTKDAAATATQEAADLGKRVARSDLGKDAAAGAAVGALIAVPVPIIGPIFGAVVGAGFGVAKNLGSASSRSEPTSNDPVDIHKALSDLADLRQKGILTDAEFEVQKKQILRRS